MLRIIRLGALVRIIPGRYMRSFRFYGIPPILGRLESLGWYIPGDSPLDGQLVIISVMEQGDVLVLFRILLLFRSYFHNCIHPLLWINSRYLPLPIYSI